MYDTKYLATFNSTSYCVYLLFGRGKIPQLMGDMAKGIKSFKKGMSDEDQKDDQKQEKNIENNPDKEK